MTLNTRSLKFRITAAVVLLVLAAASLVAFVALTLAGREMRAVIGSQQYALLSSAAAHIDADLAAARADLLRGGVCAAPVRRQEAAAGRIALNQTEGLAQLVIEQWQAADKSLPACDAAFEWAKGQQLLTPALIEARARLVARNGYGALAKVIAAPLAPEVTARIATWAALIDQPQREIDALIADPARPVDLEALQDGWLRYARKNPDDAAARFPALRDARKLDAAAASPLARSVALGMAWSRKPETLAWYAQVLPADVDGLAAEW